MENHIISKGEKERKFLEIKENKSCIFNLMGECGFHGVLLFMTNGYLNPFYEASDSVCDKIIAVNEDLEMQKQYRQERKDNRARWEGGSFGGTVVDNYAHQAELGMMNIAEGIGHSIWNAGANSVSKMVANSELKQIFADTKTRTVIEKGVFEAALHYITC